MRHLFFLFCIIMTCATQAQKSVSDSLQKRIHLETSDTGRVKLLNELAEACNIYNPDSALIVLRQALSIARQAKYWEGQKVSLSLQANTFIKLGNYPRALESHLQLLKLSEEAHNYKDMAKAYINIGSIYVYQEEYREGLPYYLKADSIINQYKIPGLTYYTNLNIGDLYDRLHQADSAFPYFKKSLEIANGMHDLDLISTSQIGLGHTYLKKKEYPKALSNYYEALPGLYISNDEDMICEATLGLARLFEEVGKSDSSAYYALQSYKMAQKDGFQTRELDAAQFLTEHYKASKRIDSAFAFMSRVKSLNDSIESKERIRQIQVLSTNERIRQQEMEEARKKAELERQQQLELLFIGIFIPGIFLITLLLSRIRIHIRLVKLMGILSLLILFEYLTLLLHPMVLELTHHKPVYEILIFVCLAAFLIPSHHRIEHLLIEKLTRQRIKKSNIGFRISSKPLKLKKNKS